MIDEFKLDEWERRFLVCIHQLKGGTVDRTMCFERLKALYDQVISEINEEIISDVNGIDVKKYIDSQNNL